MSRIDLRRLSIGLLNPIVVAAQQTGSPCSNYQTDQKWFSPCSASTLSRLVRGWATPAARAVTRTDGRTRAGTIHQRRPHRRAAERRSEKLENRRQFPRFAIDCATIAPVRSLPRGECSIIPVGMWRAASEKASSANILPKDMGPDR